MDTSSALTADAPPDARPDYPMTRPSGCPFDPPPELRELQDQAPISRVRIWDGSTPWLITRHSDQRTLLTGPRISSDPTQPGYPQPSPGIARGVGKAASSEVPDDGQTAKAEQSAFFINLDDPEHARQRRMIASAFAVKRIKAMRPAVQKIVDDLIDDMLAGPKPVDLVEAFALPLPSLVICEMLGVPYTDREFFQTRSNRLLPGPTEAPEPAFVAMAELRDYLDRLITDKQAHPADDLLSTLAEQVTTGELTQLQAANMGLILLFAGHETTANMIALGTLALLQHPDQLRLVRETQDPKLIASTVEELLRYLAITQLGLRRVACEDIEIDGVTIRAGEGIIFANDIGNRDPSAYPDPDQLDIQRNPRQQLTFGFGIHQCVGQPLARLELEIVYSTLYRRIPTLQLATDIDHIAFKHDGVFNGVYELPLTW